MALILHPLIKNIKLTNIYCTNFKNWNGYYNVVSTKSILFLTISLFNSKSDNFKVK